MKAIVTALGLVLLVTTGTRAHHSFAAEFDGSKIETIKGALVEFQWMNPHAYLIVDVTGDGGKKTRWGVQSRNLSILKRQGLSKTTFKPGESLTIELYHHIDPTRAIGFARYVTRADGTKFDLIPGGRGGTVPANP